jgi:hypothetical protein
MYYDVIFSRTVQQTATVTVAAENAIEAERKAIAPSDAEWTTRTIIEAPRVIGVPSPYPLGEEQE